MGITRMSFNVGLGCYGNLNPVWVPRGHTGRVHQGASVRKDTSSSAGGGLFQRFESGPFKRAVLVKDFASSSD